MISIKSTRRILIVCTMSRKQVLEQPLFFLTAITSLTVHQCTRVSSYGLPSTKQEHNPKGLATFTKTTKYWNSIRLFKRQVKPVNKDMHLKQSTLTLWL